MGVISPEMAHLGAQLRFGGVLCLLAIIATLPRRVGRNRDRRVYDCSIAGLELTIYIQKKPVLLPAPALEHASWQGSLPKRSSVGTVLLLAGVLLSWA